MKFTDGNWLIQPGVRPFHPSQAYEVHTDDASVTVIATTRKIAHRGDTLDGPLLSVRFSSPMEDTIGVKLTHWTGEQERGPQFELNELPLIPVMIEATEHTAALTSGKLTVRVGGEDEWGVGFAAAGEDGAEKTITSSGFRAMGLMQVEGQGAFLHEQLSLGVGELVYGLGERFTAFVKNGQVVDIWNRDGGTSSEQAYKNIPFYMTNRGYGVFVNHPGAVSFEVASEKVARVQFSVPGESLEYFVIYGPTPKEILEKYTRLTGRPALPPAWSFGLWLSTSFTTSYDEATITRFIDGMAERGLPLHVFHFDCFWMREFHWCDFQWDARVFPDPAGDAASLEGAWPKAHLRLDQPPISPNGLPLFDGSQTNTAICSKSRTATSGRPSQWQPGMGIVDFTHPGRLPRGSADKLQSTAGDGRGFVSRPISANASRPMLFMHDQARTPSADAQFLRVSLQQDGVRRCWSKTPVARAMLCSSPGLQRRVGSKFPVHWGGDCYSNFESMAESLRGGLSLGMSGFGFWSHDIGGFEGQPPEEVYKRWVAFGLLSSHSRLHGSSSYRVPWQYKGDSATDTLRHFTKLKCRLMPYLFSQAIVAHETGAPVMRAMLLEFPDDPACETLDRQYMLGENLLVAPVFASDDRVDYYIPAGTWTNILSGETVSGPGWRRERHGFLSLPLLARPNSVIAFGASDTRPDYEYADGAELRVYGLEDGRSASAVIPTVSGGVAARVTVSRSGGSYRVEAEGAAKNWSVLLVGVSEGTVSGGVAESSDLGMVVRATSPLRLEA